MLSENTVRPIQRLEEFELEDLMPIGCVYTQTPVGLKATDASDAMDATEPDFDAILEAIAKFHTLFTASNGNHPKIAMVLDFTGGVPSVEVLPAQVAGCAPSAWTFTSQQAQHGMVSRTCKARFIALAFAVATTWT